MTDRRKYCKFIGATPNPLSPDILTGHYIYTGGVGKKEGVETVELLDSMKKNALRAGFLESEIEVGYMDDTNLNAEIKANDFQCLGLSEQRQSRYTDEGAKPNEMIIALWEKVMESRPDSADALEIKRQQVKTKYPKE